MGNAVIDVVTNVVVGGSTVIANLARLYVRSTCKKGLLEPNAASMLCVCVRPVW